MSQNIHVLWRKLIISILQFQRHIDSLNKTLDPYLVLRKGTVFRILKESKSFLNTVIKKKKKRKSVVNGFRNKEVSITVMKTVYSTRTTL